MDLPNVHNEQVLWEQVQQGDRAAFAVLYDHYWQRLFLYSYNVLKDTQRSEDIVQELFLQIWQKRASTEVRLSLRAYLFAATHYRILKSIRNSQANIPLFEKLEERIAYDSPEASFSVKDLGREVEYVVSNLPDRCQQIYRLSREEQLSHKEIADRLQISTKTVEAQLTIALRRIRTHLGDLSFLAFTAAAFAPFHH